MPEHRDAAMDGTLQAARDEAIRPSKLKEFGPLETYVITPEAVAATE